MTTVTWQWRGAGDGGTWEVHYSIGEHVACRSGGVRLLTVFRARRAARRAARLSQRIHRP